MDIRVTARHFDLTQELKDYAETTIEPLRRYFDKIIDTHLILDIEKHRQMAELTMSVYGQNLIAHAVTNDMYASIDEVTDKMSRQLKKYNDRFSEHRGLSEEEKAALAARFAQELHNESGQAEKTI